MWSLKNLQVLIYVLMIYMKKYEIAYHNYAEAKRAHQVQN